MTPSARKNTVNSIGTLWLKDEHFSRYFSPFVLCNIYLQTVVGYVLPRPVHYTGSREDKYITCKHSRFSLETE